ncbi:origin recognition complex subunit 6 (ORC6) domain-containing protein [Purpureocillium lilacinum]|uniref:Uncharacterized protein n=2 Tax=Purpureocillium lilacinum TaxID=33203 RepID=A0ACC4DUV8_PURLI|nr:origin recognition complex subunit 6 (ORC6) domain-containing protein [Purpureocillium lilacinum]OAQ88479.1 origin recognition complex subunit 6 (ORC6) domain-containing protein [Purpureocillium lilacinum]
MADELASTPKKEPTAAEAMFFFAIVKHTKNKADIDWSAVADEQGFKNAEVAKVRFGQIKRKLGISTNAADSPGSASTTTRATPKRATPKKPATPKKTPGSTAGTPSKVQKSTGRTGTKGRGRAATAAAAAAAVKKEESDNDAAGGGDEGDDDDDETIIEGGGTKSTVKSEAYEGTTSQFEEEMKSIMRSREGAEAEAEGETEDPF